MVDVLAVEIFQTMVCNRRPSHDASGPPRGMLSMSKLSVVR
jgi:hypothetical protein